MLSGKLRIAPTCYHVLHLIPVTTAHEMGFFYDEGLKSDDGEPGYQMLRQAMVPPFGPMFADTILGVASTNW